MKRIAIFLDGTRNTREDKTNVLRLYDKVLPVDSFGVRQERVYDQGVGTRLTDFFTGAAFGRGVSANVREAYQKLRQMYEPGDEIFLFGFSRGAFTARSLAGFVAQYGILSNSSEMDVKELFEDYRRDQMRPPIYRILKEKEQRQLDAFETRLLEQSRITRIKFTGVWDTVGAVGLPFGQMKVISASENRFHELEPRMVFDHCYQALAVDEYRPHYRPIMWKQFALQSKLNADGQPQDKPPGGSYEQRWFIGAHSNVGGGYKNPSGLFKIPLRWMEDKASSCGLALSGFELLHGNEHLEAINDSFGDFTPYKLAFWVKRTPRQICRMPEDKTTRRGAQGRVFTINEQVDESVWSRFDTNSAVYRPTQLLSLKIKGVDTRSSN